MPKTVSEKNSKPILFSTEMLKAVLSGSKTQTRRALKLQPNLEINSTPQLGRLKTGHYGFIDNNGAVFRSPFGGPGDILWVRETWAQPDVSAKGVTIYKADYGLPDAVNNALAVDQIKWKPSIHMPKSLSRFNLKIENVRIERLQDISEDDAIAEGININVSAGDTSAKNIYKSVWSQTYGEQSYINNPWVWAIGFHVI